MTQPGYQQGSEKIWWWKVAMHLDEAQVALANAMAHNLDDPSLIFVLQDRLRDGQAILLAIFQQKGLVPTTLDGAAAGVTTTLPVPMPAAADVAEIPAPESTPPEPARSEVAAVEEAVVPVQVATVEDADVPEAEA